MDQRRDPGRQVVAVFHDRDSAKSAAVAVRDTGIAQERIRIDDKRSEVAAVRGEMREEMEHTVVGAGNVGPFTKEMTKGVLGGVVRGMAIGIVLALPLAFIEFGNVSLPARLLIAAVVGAVGGSTLGFVAGGAFGAKGPGDPLAAEQGVTLAVDLNDAEEASRVAAVLEKRGPIRLDAMLADGQATDTVTTEEEQS